MPRDQPERVAHGRDIGRDIERIGDEQKPDHDSGRNQHPHCLG